MSYSGYFFSSAATVITESGLSEFHSQCDTATAVGIYIHLQKNAAGYNQSFAALELFRQSGVSGLILEGFSASIVRKEHPSELGILEKGLI